MLYNPATMHPVEYGLFCLVVGLQAILIWRGFQYSLFRRYPWFFTYLFYTTLTNLVQLPLKLMAAPTFPKFYWSTEMVAAVVRFAVAWEVYRQIFPRGTHLRRIAGTVLGISFFTLTVLFFAMGGNPVDSLIPDFMRKMGLAAAVWILLVLGLAQYYGIRIGRNIWGMSLGLLIFVSSEVVNFSAFALSHRMAPMWGYTRPLTYVLMLLIWAPALWCYKPNPQIPVPDETAKIHALSAWRLGLADVDTAIRKVLKP